MTRFYLTTAIDYANSRPHLGTAYEKIAADVIARYKRLCGVETHFVMGNDEHSQNVFRKARELGEDPLAYCDGWRRSSSTSGSTSTSRSTTSSGRPSRATAQASRRSSSRMTKPGTSTRGTTKAGTASRARPSSRRRTSSTARARFTGRSRTGSARRTTSSGSRSTGDRLLQHFRGASGIPRARDPANEILRLIEGGLEDISVSRAGQAWGIPMPEDPSSVVYVWVDALINYITAVGFGTDDELFAKWWPADCT